MKMYSTTLQMEVTGRFDTLVHNRRVLEEATMEKEFLDFIDCAEKAIEEKPDPEYVKKLEAELAELKSENRSLKMRLRNAQRLFDMEKSKRIGVEYEKDAFERKLRTIYEFQRKGRIPEMNAKVRGLVKLFGSQEEYGEGTEGSNLSPKQSTFLSEIPSSTMESIANVSDLNFTVEEDGESRSRSGKSLQSSISPNQVSPSNPKRKRATRSPKLEEPEIKDENAVVKDSSVAQTPPNSPLDVKTPEGNSPTDCMSGKNPETPLSNPFQRSYVTSQWSGTVCSTPSASSLSLRSSRRQNRPHVFASRTIYKSSVCQQCGGKFKFGNRAYKCNDCRSLVHSGCRDEVPLPCVPIQRTPGGSKRKSQNTIADFCPRIAPMVPALIVHCTNEIERRGLEVTGLYRVTGSGKQVRELRDRFLEGKSLPNLTSIDVTVIADTVKSFLLSLKEPVIPLSLWTDFVVATKKAETEAVQDTFAMCYQSIADMPQPNRDTLAWLMCHLQKVSESEECQMPVSNLATIFGPSIVGYSVANPTAQIALNEVKFQQKVLEFLLSITPDYWQTFITVAETVRRSTSTPTGVFPPFKKRKSSLNFSPF